MCKRIGVVGIVMEEPQEVLEDLNRYLGMYKDIIIGRMGIPGRNGKASVISLIVEGTTDEISGLTGKIGNLKGVSVKTALTKNK